MKTGKVCFITVIIYIISITSGISQNKDYEFSLKVIVTRSDNGRKLVGANVEFRHPFYRTYTTNNNGEIFLRGKEKDADFFNICISKCYAIGYYPAPIYIHGYEYSGAAVAFVNIRRNAPHQTISISLDSQSRFDPVVTAPVLISPYDGFNASTKDEIGLKWKRVQWAASYEIQVSHDSDFSKLCFKNSNIINVSNQDEYQSVPGYCKFRSYFWRVRAFDGIKWSDWSEVRAIMVR